jgi:thiol-disulfide isomerase/thioredoxin
MLPTLGFAQPKLKTSFNLTGQVMGMDSGLVYLYYGGINGAVSDSCFLNHGLFLFRGEVQEPVEAIFSAFNFTTNDRGKFQAKNISGFYLEPGKIKLIATRDQFRDLKTEGSVSDSDRMRLLEMEEPVEAKIRPVMKVYDELAPIYNMEYRKNAKSDRFKFLQKKLDSVNKILDPLYAQRLQIDSSFIADNPESYVAANMFYRGIEGGSIKEYPDLNIQYERIPVFLRESEIGKRIREVVESERNIYVGRDAVNFIVLTKSGDTISLNKFRGKYILLDFWGSWCVPCRHITPLLRAVNAKYKDKLEIISIANHDKESDWLQAIKKDSMEWTQILDDDRLKKIAPEHGTITDAYYINGVPSLILIDRNSRIVKLFGNGGQKRLPIYSLDEEIAKALAN